VCSAGAQCIAACNTDTTLQLTVESYYKSMAKLTTSMGYWIGLYRRGEGCCGGFTAVASFGMCGMPGFVLSIYDCI
jgi:hypothetical protein